VLNYPCLPTAPIFTTTAITRTSAPLRDKPLRGRDFPFGHDAMRLGRTTPLRLFTCLQQRAFASGLKHRGAIDGDKITIILRPGLPAYAFRYVYLSPRSRTRRPSIVNELPRLRLPLALPRYNELPPWDSPPYRSNVGSSRSPTLLRSGHYTQFSTNCLGSVSEQTVTVSPLYDSNVVPAFRRNWIGVVFRR
jgi:hypothetical protein